MGLEHPDIREIETWGYPKSTQDYEYLFSDALGNEVYTGDEYYEFNDEKFLKEALSCDAIEILEMNHAVLKIAK